MCLLGCARTGASRAGTCHVTARLSVRYQTDSWQGFRRKKPSVGAPGYHFSVVQGFKYQLFAKEQPNDCSEHDPQGRALFNFIYHGGRVRDIRLAGGHCTPCPLPVTCQIDHFYNISFSPSFFTSHCMFLGSGPHGKYL